MGKTKQKGNAVMRKITELKEKNYDYIKEEMTQIVDVCRKHNVISKVIFENCYLIFFLIILLNHQNQVLQQLL